MIRCVLFLVFGLVAVYSPVTAQQTGPSRGASYTFALYQPEIFDTVDGSTLINRLPVLTFLDGTRFPVSSELGRMGTAPLDFPSLAYVSAAKTPKAKAAQSHPSDGKDFETDGKDSSAEVMNSPLNPIHYSGETGVFYGRSSGKFGGDAFGSYIQSSIGNDKFQINVGVSYEESNGRFPRWGR